MKNFTLKGILLMICMFMGVGSAMAQILVSGTATYNGTSWSYVENSVSIDASPAISFTSPESLSVEGKASISVSIAVENKIYVQSTTVKGVEYGSEVAFTQDGDTYTYAKSSKGNGKVTINLSSITVTYTYYKFVSATLNAACTDGEWIYGTFSSSQPLVVSGDVIAAEIGIVDDKLYVEEYETGGCIPANTGVMLSAFEGGVYNLMVAANEGESVLGEDNCLRPSGDKGITEDKFDNINYTYYRLTMHNGTQIGYWWGAADGRGFNLGPNKAYLQVAKSASHDEDEDDLAKIDGLWFGDEATAISAVATAAQQNGVAYNLAGQRVTSTGSATGYKGIVIMNGRKYINK